VIQQPDLNLREPLFNIARVGSYIVAVQPVARPRMALLCRQPAFHLGGDAQPPGLPERISSPLSQRHLACLSDHFRRSGIPIMALGRLCEYSFKRRANHDASRISESATRPVTGDCLTTPNGAGPAWSLDFRFAAQYCSGCKIKPGSQPIPKMPGNHRRSGLLVSRNDPAQSRSSERHCAKISGGQRGLRPLKPWRGRTEKSGNLGNPHAEKMLQRRSQPIHDD
jgi:hypothetical protein